MNSKHALADAKTRIRLMIPYHFEKRNKNVITFARANMSTEIQVLSRTIEEKE